MKPFLTILLLTVTLGGFAQGTFNYKGVDSFPLNTGDIAFNATLDDSTFSLCNPRTVFQYYNTDSYYKQHKREIEHYFKSHYHPTIQTARETGYLTIRFIINCKGQTDRFRLYELNADYQPYQFDTGISSQLLKLTKELRGWQPAVYKNKIYDSYQYITFKLTKGAIECILP
ncbi:MULTISPECIES: hypothetical protein [Niastella]|uniref:TonB C-terminal domain-containing protein n=1 Tax=Niastella soli TaxID=2821487 RepID=A0ABS3YW67_9BACT|nr:hypothetical protein [Niastella soli]MBO9202174.1 hypothetical protein [Niastella soli]